MAHDWWDPRPNDAHRLMEPPFRKCRNCGAEQHLQTYTWYMRIDKRRWEPLVGRCPGKKVKRARRSAKSRRG